MSVGSSDRIIRMEDESLTVRLEVGFQIKARRKQLGYPSNRFCEMTGIKPDHLRKVELGIVVPDHYHDLVTYLIETLEYLEQQTDGKCHLRLVA